MEGVREWPKLISRRGPQSLLYGFCLALLIGGAFYRGHSVESMDVRTYAQMIRGVAEHGLPYWDNGPIDRFKELVVPWGIPAHGHLWGMYGPVYPTLLAPFYKIGGLRGVSAATFALLAPLALVTFLLTKRLGVRSEWSATGAAVLAVISTPVMAKSLEMTAFPMTALLAVAATYALVRLLSETRSPRLTAALVGLLWGLAATAHAATFPMAFGAFLVVFAAPPRQTLDGIRQRLVRIVPVIGGFSVVLLPVALLNHVRFGSYNPISYGPMPWTGMLNPELHRMNAGAQIKYSLPLAALFGVALLVAFGLRRRRARAGAIGELLPVVVLASALLLALAVEPLRTRLFRLLMIGFGYVVDATVCELEPPYAPVRDGLGRVFAGWVVKSTLQCTPIMFLAPLALRGAPRERRWPLIAVVTPAAFLFLSLAMRANLGTYNDALGWPWVYIRYTMAALPLLVVASVVVVDRLVALRPSDVATIAVVGGLLVYGYSHTPGDESLVKRFGLLVAPLIFGSASLIAVLWLGVSPRPLLPIRLLHVPSWATRQIVGVTIALGIAAGLGHDMRANVEAKRALDEYVTRVEGVVPARFAVVGMLGQFDQLLTTAATHDVQYADVLRLTDFKELRPLLEHWRAERRPTYLAWNSQPYSPWPDVVFTPQPLGLYLVEFK